MNGDGVLDSGDVVFGKTVADSDGSYTFGNLPDSSDWIVAVDTGGTFLSGAAQTTQLLTSGVAPFSISGANVSGVDFGYTKPPTYALVSAVWAGPGRVEWTTSAEIGTLGFYLLRWDEQTSSWLAVNPDHGARRRRDERWPLRGRRS